MEFSSQSPSVPWRAMAKPQGLGWPQGLLGVGREVPAALWRVPCGGLARMSSGAGNLLLRMSFVGIFSRSDGAGVVWHEKSWKQCPGLVEGWRCQTLWEELQLRE